jgi:hypothetical protein
MMHKKNQICFEQEFKPYNQQQKPYPPYGFIFYIQKPIGESAKALKL